MKNNHRNKFPSIDEMVVYNGDDVNIKNICLILNSHIYGKKLQVYAKCIENLLLQNLKQKNILMNFMTQLTLEKYLMVTKFYKFKKIKIINIVKMQKYLKNCA